MLSWLRNLFDPSPELAPIAPGEPVPPGLEVTVPGTGCRGTVTAFVDGPNGTRARIVVVAPERSWIETVSLHRLEL